MEPTIHAPHWEPHYHYECKRCWPNGTPPPDERIDDGGAPWDDPPPQTIQNTCPLCREAHTATLGGLTRSGKPWYESAHNLTCSERS